MEHIIRCPGCGSYLIANENEIDLNKTYKHGDGSWYYVYDTGMCDHLGDERWGCGVCFSLKKEGHVFTAELKY